MTSVPPCANAPQISQTEKSNAYEWNSVQTSREPNENRRPAALNNRATLPCSTTTPLGLPVEPDV